MTPPHTPESLLALKESPEGLEQLRIIAAEFDTHEHCRSDWFANPSEENEVLFYSNANWCGLTEESRNFYGFYKMPNYPTSLDAIFAAEERLGLHDNKNEDLRSEWRFFMRKMFADLHRCNLSTEIAFLPPPLRLIPFILTAQWKEQNQ